MNATACSPYVPCGLRQEVALVRLVPLYILTAPPQAAETIVPTLYDPEEFAALYHADKQRVIALLSAMTAPQRVRQALVAWRIQRYLSHTSIEDGAQAVDSNGSVCATS